MVLQAKCRYSISVPPLGRAVLGDIGKGPELAFAIELDV